MKVREGLRDVGTIIRPRRIVYFEDPFGRTEYEGIDSLEREIGTILDTIGQVEDAYVVLTSREEVFKEFEKQKISAQRFEEFERKLNLKRPSYDRGKRKAMLLGWAKERNCKWLNAAASKGCVLQSMEDPGMLPTPLSIKDFTVSTGNVDTQEQLLEKAREKSEETEKAFAREIENMTGDKILFLSFLFISDQFQIAFLRKEYGEMAQSLGLRPAMAFDAILRWFSDDKIEVAGERIRFSHPSYETALKHLLVKDGRTTWINREILSPLLLKLSDNSDNKEAARWVAHVVANNFDRLPEEVRNLLFKLAETKEAASDVAHAVAMNFDKLPAVVRNNLLFKLAEIKGAAGSVAYVVANYFDQFPAEVRNLLFKLAESKEAAGVAYVVANYFDKLPAEVRNLLFKLAENKEAAGWVAWAVADNFDHLPGQVRNNLLFKLAENKESAWTVASAVAENFDKLPEEVRGILFKLAKNEESAWTVASALANYFDKLPAEVRNNLLKKIAEKGWEKDRLPKIVKAHHDKIPDDIRTLILGPDT